MMGRGSSAAGNTNERRKWEKGEIGVSCSVTSVHIAWHTYIHKSCYAMKEVRRAQTRPGPRLPIVCDMIGVRDDGRLLPNK